MGKTVATAATRRSNGAKKGNGQELGIATEVRQRYIAEAAYFRAKERGFHGGEALADWLAAEAEIDARYPAPN
ncbi:hypothetical protein BURK2_03450 [Burkholderiales bacterium]|nr:MAG: DUF2934 domain-containing protein [Burkholderiales bacterium]CAG1006089.1 hypothetical protein BURK2_03450 [Burkholderiales bacterium]